MTRKILVPSLGESVSEGIVASWLKHPGEAVQVDEVVMELETDKVTIEVLAPETGLLVSHEVAQGDTVTPATVLGLIAVGGEAGASTGATPDAAPDTAPAPVPDTAPVLDTAPVPETAPPVHSLSPAVEKLAAENPQIDLTALKGSGKDGRVTKGDMLAASATPAPAPSQLQQHDSISPPPVLASLAPSAPPAPSAVPSADRERRVRMTGLRRTIAKRLKQAQNTAAILTTYNEVDMSAIKALRTTHQEAFVNKHGIKLGFMSFFVTACCQALKEIPVVNAEIDDQELVYKNYYNIGVAVGTPTGLVVPVIRDVDQLGFAEIEKTIADFGARARDGKLAVREMTGGTFTISNGGTYGSLLSAPILNPPQSGILGMHKIQDRPVAVNGQVEIRPMMYLALSYDHRLIDGKEAVTFLVKVKESLENPGRLLLGI